ncbi:MAG: MBL fold metallo-hydrolase [Comamonadaceae bacterium]|nr:MAG: MBL fold metallo-hydrolase [Comamonadaceae bacterium]
MLRFRNLGSGSAGNATVVEAHSGTQTVRLLIDCGLGIRRLDACLAEAGLAATQIDAVFITHEHSDHIGCARSFALRERVPVWMSEGTFAGINMPDFDGLFRAAQDGVAIDLGSLQVMPFTVPHDAREPLQLTCTDGNVRLGVLTDLGHATQHVLAHLAGCHALLLECNHETDLLANGAYPYFLKQRVGGKHGHLANAAAAAIAQALRHPALGHVVAAHLSEQNNRPELARTALAQALGRRDDDIVVACQQKGTGWLDA